MSESSSIQSSLQVIFTDDGSQTVFNKELNSTYHSTFGAVTESQHVFILQGLQKLLDKNVTKITLLEMGFGTGLNTLLTANIASKENIIVNYHALETHPLPENIWKEYVLPQELADSRELFNQIHSAKWDNTEQINPNLTLVKHNVSLLNYKPNTAFDLVYFDAFDPEIQPELWTAEVFEKIYSWMNPEGILTTYCCKGYVRRNMLAAGFQVEKVPGPPGKREMICAKKPL